MNTNKKIKIKNKAILHSESLVPLLEEQEDWFFKRHGYIQKGEWDKADLIEKKQLIPLQRKIDLLITLYPN